MPLQNGRKGVPTDVNKKRTVAGNNIVNVC